MSGIDKIKKELDALISIIDEEVSPENVRVYAAVELLRRAVHEEHDGV